MEPAQAYQQALRFFQESGDRFRVLGANVSARSAYGNVGRIAARHRDWERAAQGYGQAIDALEEVRLATARMRDRQAWMESNVALFKGMVEACLRLERFDTALEYVERGRTRSLIDLLIIEDLAPRNVPPEKAEEYRRFRRRAEELEAMFAQDETAPDQERRAVSSEEKVEVGRRLRSLEEELRRLDADFLPVAQPLTADELRALARDLARTVVIIWSGPEMATAFFVDPKGQIDLLPLEGLNDAAIDEWVIGSQGAEAPGGWLGTYARYRAGVASRADWMAQIDRTLADLYRGLMGPIHRRLRERGEERIALVVAGSLGLLPLHAASWEVDGLSRYLVDELEILFVPSAWVLRRCVERKRSQSTPMLGIGNPSTTTDAPLPFGQWEVERIGAMVDARVGPRSFTPLIGMDAGLSSVGAALQRHPVAHFSCHGYWDFQDVFQSALMLAGGDRLSLAQLIGPMDLTDAAFVVLSACESGTGYRSGDEYLGLPAGFIIAGAQTVVGSLWSVLDPPTALLMVRMYDTLLTGGEAGAALREAQCWLRGLSRAEALAQAAPHGNAGAPALPADLWSDYQEWLDGLDERPFDHPYYWAAFQVLGAPSRLVEPG
jgi:CHAT domain-containing protein